MIPSDVDLSPIVTVIILLADSMAINCSTSVAAMLLNLEMNLFTPWISIKSFLFRITLSFNQANGSGTMPNEEINAEPELQPLEFQ